jgi:triacylglycerol lipase
MFLTAWLGVALSLLDGTARAPHRPAPGRNPVLLIHGIADNSDCMTRMALYLRAEGWEVHTIDLTPNWGQAGLEPLAATIQRYANAELRGRKFDLVGFSMGGLVSRYYVQRLGGLDRIERFVTISAPHHGTELARLIPNDGCRAMRPGSKFLRCLDSDADRLRQVKFTSLYTPWDAVIVPARSSVMPQARNVKVPVGSHPGMILRKPSLRAVASALRT